MKEGVYDGDGSEQAVWLVVGDFELGETRVGKVRERPKQHRDLKPQHHERHSLLKFDLASHRFSSLACSGGYEHVHVRIAILFVEAVQRPRLKRGRAQLLA